MVDHDKELFLLISNGDEKAFYRLFHLYNKQLIPFILKLTNAESDAEEIVQEVFIKIWLNRQKLSEIDIPKAWIIRVVSNQCYNYLRKKALDGKLLKIVQQKSQMSTPTPEELTAAKQIEQIISEGVSQLPAQMKLVYQLNKEKGLTVSEISVMLNVSQNTVRNQLVTATKKLRSHLQENMLVILWLLDS